MDADVVSGGLGCGSLSGLRHGSTVGLVLFFKVDELNLLIVGELIVELLFFFYHDDSIEGKFWLVSGEMDEGELVV